MTTQQFIFSNDRKHRLIRHLTFWVAYCILSVCAEMATIDSLHELKSVKTYKFHLMFFVLFLPMSVFMVYIFIYVLIPGFILTKKYFAFIAAAIATLLFCLVVNMIPDYLFYFNYPYPPATSAGRHWLYFSIDYQHTLHEGIALAGLVTCIKLIKGWYLQQIENNRLAKLDAENRSKLFKSQIQPEFLFHSLQSLYKKIQHYPDEAPRMVINLSDIFSYILYDCNEKYVMLEKELTAIQNFIINENMNEVNNTKINIEIHGDYQHKWIVPLTLFSFLEKRLYPLMVESSHEKSILIIINISDFTLTITVPLKNQLANPENIQSFIMDKKWQDNLPDNISSYQMIRNKSENAFIIDATIDLLSINNAAHLQHHSSDLN